MTARSAALNGLPRTAATVEPAPVIVLGGGAQHRRFLSEIRRRGHSLVLVDQNAQAPCRELADHFFQRSIHDTRACERALSAWINATTRLVTFATGRAGLTCVELCRRFGLPSRSQRLAAAVSDKRMLQQNLERAGLATLPARVVGARGLEAALAETSFPAILKPAQGGGGIQVARVGTIDEARARCIEARSNGPMLLQPWIEGLERVVCLLVRGGRPVALLHGENILEPSTGWPWPIGLTLERVACSALPSPWSELVPRWIDAFDLVDDFVVIELISNDRGHFVIDVEMNALGPFACSEVMEDGALVRALVDTYLGEPVRDSDRGWLAGLAFVASREASRIHALRGRRYDTEQFHFEGGETWAQLECPGHRIYKGGYVVTKCAQSHQEARRQALAFASHMESST